MSSERSNQLSYSPIRDDSFTEETSALSTVSFKKIDRR